MIKDTRVEKEYYILDDISASLVALDLEFHYEFFFPQVFFMAPPSKFLRL